MLNQPAPLCPYFATVQEKPNDRIFIWHGTKAENLRKPARKLVRNIPSGATGVCNFTSCTSGTRCAPSSAPRPKGANFRCHGRYIQQIEVSRSHYFLEMTLVTPKLRRVVGTRIFSAFCRHVEKIRAGMGCESDFLKTMMGGSVNGEVGMGLLS